MRQARILIHDFGGYPFAAQLSRTLAFRGHDVMFSWCSSVDTTPGAWDGFATRDGDPSTLAFEPLDLGAALDKYRLVKRWRQERLYGRLAARLTEAHRPDAVVLANVPLDAQSQLYRAAKRLDAPVVNWLQDLIGIGTHRLLGSTMSVIGAAVGRHYMRVEARLLRRSAAVVAITDDFVPTLERWGIERERIATLENWAPVSELPVRPKDNEWARAAGLTGRFVFLYTGAIGIKQDRELILRLASAYRDRDDVRVVVLSRGPDADYIRSQAAERGLDGLTVRDFVPWRQLPDVMGAADVLVAALHGDAGEFSVPSKVLTYLCARRPVLVSVPAENLAARIVVRERAGIVAAPGEPDAFIDGAERLLASADERDEMGGNARRYAERTFAIDPIADRFEEILANAIAARLS